MRYLILVISTLLLLPGCAFKATRLERVTTAEFDQVLAGDTLVLGDHQAEKLPEADLFGMSVAMKQFVDMTVAGLGSEDEKIRALLEAVLSPGRLGVKYDDSATYTASEAFQQRRVNCLSFTIMMVTMLRYLGMDVAFNQVEVPPIWDLQGESLVLSQHVNALVTKSYGAKKIIDINLREYELYYPQRTIDDRVIAALYYNNRGMESMLAGEVRQSFLNLHQALKLAPELPYIWTNLGTLYRERGRLSEAEIAYRLALQREPGNLIAISKAQRNYTDLGDVRMAEYFRQRAVLFREKNPYYHYARAKDEVLRGDYSGALADIQVAISMYKKEHRFFFLQGVIYSALTDRGRADASFKKALELTASQQQQEAYRRKMEKLI